MTLRLASCLLILLAAGPALADDVARVGEKAPDIYGAVAFHDEGGKRRLRDFEGEVVGVVFFCAKCRTGWVKEPLGKLLETWGDQGLAVLGSMDGETVIDDRTTAMAREYTADFTFPVVFGCAPATAAYGVRSRPVCILVGHDGTLLWQGAAGSAAVPEPLLREALAARWRAVLAAHPGTPPTLLGHLTDGRLPRAWAEAKKAGLEDLAAALGKRPATDLARADGLHDERRYREARAAYEPLAAAWKDTEFGSRAAERLAEYRTAPLKKELALLEDLERLRTRLAGSDPARAAESLRAFARRCEGTAAADRAREEAERLAGG